MPYDNKEMYIISRAELSSAWLTFSVIKNPKILFTVRGGQVIIVRV